ncbi:tumor necrosis factor receptor superfamily member 9a [Hippoglossus stenolepis]|uniref:tumor necrosis factor receptor superfamily member 9a n=1 Tax=Hippoglossus stenolepis TaxID=195615 RepID=UPI00159C1D85|nr:tumor necrosis factor receptor superfamily member 9a [Hippoglossus stenolepis]
MAAILRVMGFSLLMQGCLSSVGHTDTGCMRWTPNGKDSCCDACRPGNHLVRRCGTTLGDLCTPCESGTFQADPGLKYMCNTCTQCAGAQVYVKVCTPTKDAECGCKQGLLCGDGSCTFCIKKCDKGEEPTKERSCRPCPTGTFNDQGHQMCKPWETKCPNLDQYIVSHGTTTSDITCASVALSPLHKPSDPGTTEQKWPLVLSVVTSLALTSFIIIIILTVTMKHVQKRKKTQKIVTNTVIIRTPTDHPLPLRAVECSFHEAEQEEGGSSESLDTKESSDQLLP